MKTLLDDPFHHRSLDSFTNPLLRQITIRSTRDLVNGPAAAKYEKAGAEATLVANNKQPRFHRYFFIAFQ